MLPEGLHRRWLVALGGLALVVVYGAAPVPAQAGPPVSARDPLGTRDEALGRNPLQRGLNYNGLERVAATVHLSGGGQWGYVWANEPTSNDYQPALSYQGNSTGAPNRITRWGPGRYTVQFTNLDTFGGTVNVTAYGTSGHTCKVGGWGPSGGNQYVSVYCFSAIGSPDDTYFTASFTYPGQVPGAFGFVWADQPTNPAYNPSATYSFNTTGATNDIARHDVGRYTVHMPGLSGAGHRTVKVTAYGWESTTCELEGWHLANDVWIDVVCHDAWGFPVDSYYTVTMAHQDTTLLGVTNAARAFGWAHQETEPSPYEPVVSFNSTGGTNTAERSSTGDYTVRLPGLGHDNGHVQVTAIPPSVIDIPHSTRRCKVGYWFAWGDELLVNVRCFDHTGGPADSEFAFSYTR
jgi:hypothetical protein